MTDPKITDGLRGFLTDDEIQVIGALESNVCHQIGFRTQCRSVFIGRSGRAHIAESRSARSRTDAEAVAADVEYVLANMAAVIRHPLFYGMDPETPGRVLLVESISPKHLCLALKLVTAARAGTSSDEIWITTGYPLGEKSLRRYLRTGRLSPVKW